MVTMKAPATAAPGSTVYLPDGTKTTVDADGFISISAAFIPQMLAGGFELLAAGEGLALTDGDMFVGNAQDAATGVTPSGDIAVASNGAMTVNATKLASSENSYGRTDVGTKDILAAAAAARKVMIVVTVTTAFANGDGAQPTLTIGEESGSATKFAAAAKFTGAVAGTTFAFAGTLTSGKKLQAVLAAATGSTSTGAYTIDVIAVG